MSNEIQKFLSEVATVTGSPLPQLMEKDAPVLRADSAEAKSFYLIGLIGGKEVGKSALVNALAGQQIAEPTAYGPGTEHVVAYVHNTQVEAVKALLSREAAGRHKIAVHSIASLERQILLDLPDIDSQFSDHVELTRRMLRHMLFPIWVQSVEKYADQQPQKLLAAVAEGNDPANFLFCLNKADQVASQAIDELRDDFAARISRTLGGSFTPKVYVVSAIRPDTFDLPALRDRLSQQRSAATVKQSIDLAGRQQDRSMLSWLDSQGLPQRAQRLARLEQEAEDLVAARLSVPLLEQVIPRLMDDSGHRAAVIDEAMSARVARWPVVNVLHTLLLPLTSLWRRNVGAAATPQALVQTCATIQGRDISAVVAATFAMMQQSHPMVGALYRQRRLWDDAPADAAAMELRETLAGVMERQRIEAARRIARRGVIAPIIRWTLTIGAVIWFPIVQPVLELMLRDNLTQTFRGALLLAVQLLGATYLLKSSAFLAIWFIFLWLVLRWDTQRRVAKLLANWQKIDGGDAAFGATSAALLWVDDLLEPIRAARRREQSLVERAESLRQQFDKPAA